MITEADARVLEPGTTVVLVIGGHITPLAQDTLTERRISVINERQLDDSANLAPRADVRTVALAGDHTSLALKRAIVTYLRGRGIAAHDLGTMTSDPVDYPDTAAAAAFAVARGEADAAIVIDGSGLGSTIAANKVPGARAAMCLSEMLARYARQHNGANVLTLGSKTISNSEMREIVRAWLATELTEDRHRKRVGKIDAIERQYQR